MTQLHTTRYHGADIAPQVEALAALRIRVFRDFPYLYDGDISYERDYLATYVSSPRSLAFWFSTAIRWSARRRPCYTPRTNPLYPASGFGHKLDSL